MSKYTYCPDCCRKTVYFRMWVGGEDHYQCRMKSCEFFFFIEGNYPKDRESERRWEDHNRASDSGTGSKK
jgi:hypothetical protein